MNTSRRGFIRTSFAAGIGGMAMGLGGVRRARAAAASAGVHRAEGKSLLILGGTDFIGPHIVDAAKALGYQVTLFNRGKTEVRKQTPIEGVEKIVGDRDPDVGEGLRNLEARIKEKGGWDAVIDTSGYVPRIVRASAELLAPVVQQYQFISTISVYADHSKPGADESDTLATLKEPGSEDVQAHYGALKALCEEAVVSAAGDRACNVRPGFIVGPGDPTDRFTYWPVRFDKGGDVLVPGTPDDPVQFIDARDLAAFCMRLVENRTMGVFNVTGPVGGCTVGRFVEACRAAASRPSNPVYVDAEHLAAQGIKNVTILIPPRDGAEGFHQRSIDKAAKAGLRTRPIEETVRDTLAWWSVEVERRVRVTRDILASAEEENAKLRAEGKPEKEVPKMPDPRQLRAGLDPEKEAAILSAYRNGATGNNRGGPRETESGENGKN